ncbi:F-box domain-containing protein [Mycena chlorophos]|uniref:F-box domain-containing protein n=1 Tax=Mycena chlorophos TaxID=658473 RepID=A0A8H6SPQ9_MYCCL|nr:F-box domain-containing protein [Mycena chlorophos]
MAHPAAPELDCDALKSIDNKIAQHLDAIYALRRQRNAYMKVNRLPPEVLSRIFAFCVLPDSTKWVKEVCAISSYWRDLALATPGLWSTPIFYMYRPVKAEQMLKRAKNALLTLHASGIVVNGSLWPAFRSALSNPSRIRELSVTAIAAMTAEQTQELFGLAESAPYLTHLSLSAPSRYDSPSHALLPTTFLNGDAPRLRTLQLEKVNIDWDSTLMSSNITELALRHVNVGSVLELVAALGRMPQLESILLDDTFPLPDTVSSSRPSTTTPLIQLKSLHLNASSTTGLASITDVLERLSYPLDTKITITCCTPSKTASEIFARLLRNLPTVDTSESCRLRALHLVGTSLSLAVLASSWKHVTSSLAAGWCTSRGSALLDVSIRLLDANQSAIDEMAVLLGKSLPIQDLRQLSVSGLGLSSVRSWIHGGFGDFKCLKSVRLSRESLDAFISAAGEDVVVDGVKQTPAAPAVRLEPPRRSSRRLHPQLEMLSGGLFFPALRHLEIEGTDFDDENLGRLETMLMARCERRQEISRLELFDCTRLRADDVALLRDIVVDVVWDGLEQGFTDSEDSYDDEDLYGYGDDSMYDSDEDFFPYHAGHGFWF